MYFDKVLIYENLTYNKIENMKYFGIIIFS